MTCWLVTGGAGFIGSHLVESLVRAGHTVRILDNFSSGHREHLAAVQQKVDIIEGDIRDAALVTRSLQGVDVVAHLAAIASVQLSLQQPLMVWDVNVNGTLTLLEQARQANVRRFVFASSASIYGDQQALPLSENLPPRPLSPYAASKLAGEGLCQAYAYAYQLETVALRAFNVYGPRQDPGSPYSGVITIFLEHIQRGVPPTIYGDGAQTRDFVHVRDVAQAYVAASQSAGGSGAVYNIGTGRETSLNALLALFCDCAQVQLVPTYAAAKPGDIRRSVCNPTQARTALSWQTQVGLREGLLSLLRPEGN